MKLSELRIRDPFIAVHDHTYYLYGTIGEDRGEQTIYTFRSPDMEDWEGPIPVFTIPPDFWGVKDLWAPEVHCYHSKFYLFFSALGKNGLRGTQIAVCDRPDGTFVPVSDTAATPPGQSCIDGTLYVEDDRPYIVYSHDWPDVYRPEGPYFEGEICALELSPDLKKPVGKPFLLFTSTESPVSASAATPLANGQIRYGSDGPFLTRLSDGTLVLTWSPIPAMNYLVLAAVSDNGSIHGHWKHVTKPIFDKNGGHAMFFDDPDGQKKMVFHCPEKYPFERTAILNVCEKDGMWVVKDDEICTGK